MKRDQRFPVVLSKAERRALDQLAQDELLSAASIVRRLIIREAKQRGFWPPEHQQQIQAQIRQELEVDRIPD